MQAARLDRYGKRIERSSVTGKPIYRRRTGPHARNGTENHDGNQGDRRRGFPLRNTWYRLPAACRMNEGAVRRLVEFVSEPIPPVSSPPRFIMPHKFERGAIVRYAVDGTDIFLKIIRRQVRENPDGIVCTYRVRQIINGVIAERMMEME